MRSRIVPLAAGLLVALAGCSEPPPPLTPDECVARVKDLSSTIDAGGSFDEVYAAYKEAKDALERVEGDEQKTCERAYERIKAKTEVALRRDNLSVMGWIMAFFAATVLWGGCAVCVAIALKATKTIGGNGDE